MFGHSKDLPVSKEFRRRYKGLNNANLLTTMKSFRKQIELITTFKEQYNLKFESALTLMYVITGFLEDNRSSTIYSLVKESKVQFDTRCTMAMKQRLTMLLNKGLIENIKHDRINRYVPTQEAINRVKEFHYNQVTAA